MGLPKPIILISYSHRDEPEHPRDGEVQWLSFVRTYLQPAVKHGVFNVWDDRHMTGGEDWDPEIERNLRECGIFILLVSAHAMASNYIIDKEIANHSRAAGEGRTGSLLPVAADADAQSRAGKGQGQESAPARWQAVLGLLCSRSPTAHVGCGRRDRGDCRTHC